MGEEENKALDFQLPKGYRCIWLESILREFRIETHESWYRQDDDWLVPPMLVYEEPGKLDLYSIIYTIIPEMDDEHHQFALALIESMQSYVEYLESCLEK